MKPKLSLKGRGLQLLAQREHSRVELRRKLMPYARAECETADAGAQSGVRQGVSAATEGAIKSPATLPSVFVSPHGRGADSVCSGSPEDDAHPGAGSTTPADLVESVLDWLQARGYLNEERFVESRVHARAARFGNQRIRQELAQHGVALAPEELQALKDSELARARSVWSRKFHHPAIDAAERARQMRFLAGRGFSSDVVRRVVQGGDDD